MIEIICDDLNDEKKYDELIKKVINKTLEVEEVIANVDVYVTITNNTEIQKINKEYREVDKATDVLSFPMYDRAEIPDMKKNLVEPELILGDIIVSTEKIKEQAKEYGHSFERELAYMMVHGMLHLLGYDHMIDEEKNVMREREEFILNNLNIRREL